MDYVSELKKILQGKYLAILATVSVSYIVLSIYAVNSSIIGDTLFGNYPLSYKTTLLQSILIGSWNMYPPIEAFLLITIGILLGINIALMAKIFTALSANKGLKVSFGGSSVLAIVSAGCPACGISLLSVVGISIPFLPLSGVPLQLLAVSLLSGSIVYSLYKLQQPMVCEVNGVKTKQRSK